MNPQLFCSGSISEGLDSPKVRGLDASEELWSWTFIHTRWTLRYVSQRIFFSQIVRRFHMWSIYIKMMGWCLLLRNNCSASIFFLFFIDSKIFGKFPKNRLITSRNLTSFLNFSMVSGLFDQLQIFCHTYLIESVGILMGLVLLNLWHLIYPRLLAGSSMLAFLTNSSLMEF